MGYMSMKLYKYREVVLIQTGWSNPVEGPDILPEGYREIEKLS